MSRLIARLLLSLLMLPLASVAYIVAFFALERMSSSGYRYRYDEQRWFALAGVVTFVLIIAYWLLLWRGVVKWTAARLTLTGWAAPCAAAAGAAVYLAIGGLGGRSGDRSFAAFLGSVVAPLSWLVATVWIWRETRGERAQRLREAARGGVACPACGYNLTGLTTTRCPECGTQFTLDELLAQRAGKDAADLEGE